MSITISGILYNSNNERLKYTEVFLQAISTTGDMVASASTSFRTNNNGYYSKTLNEGTYRIFVRKSNTRQYYLVKDKFVIDQNTTATTLNDLLI